MSTAVAGSCVAVAPSAPQCGRWPSVADDALLQEHGVLLRLLGRLQHRLEAHRQAHERELGALKGEVVWLRAQAVVAHTRACWGLGAQRMPLAHARRAAHPAGTADSQRVEPASLPTPPLTPAQAVLCQTACTGHAHPWLGAGGQCRLSGQTCEAGRVSSHP